MKKLLLGEDGKLRYLWRAILFFVVGTWVVYPVFASGFPFVAKALHLTPGLAAGNIALNEIANFLVALICTAPFAFYEGRRIDSYGLAVSRVLGTSTFEGAAAGIVMAGAVATGMVAFGGMQIRGLALTGSALVYSAFAWLFANIWVGLAEEFFYRSYFLQALWKSIGFWPASVATSLVFAADHYFYKPGENIWDVITLVSLSLCMCYSVLKTGSLWFAVGFHFTFDIMQLFVIGTPNGAHVPQGRLLDATFNGSAWLTGGVLGTEASFLMYPMIALIWIYVWWRFPGTKAQEAAAP